MKCVPACLCAVTVLLSSLLVTASPASATPPTLAVVVCAGENVINYTPGLTNTPRTVTISGQDTASTCVDVLRPLQHLSFTAPFEGTFTSSCTQLLAGGTGTETLYWNTGEKSVWQWNLRFSNTLAGQLQAVADGPITSGRYAGTTLRQVINQVEGDLGACNTPAGMTSSGGPSEWTFTSV